MRALLIALLLAAAHAADLYAVLGVPDSATQEEIEAAYQRKVREVHPDAGGSADAFCAVQEAYRALTDPHVPMRRRLGAEQEESKTLVLRRPDTMKFVKYVSAAAPGSRWDVAAEYSQ